MAGELAAEWIKIPDGNGNLQKVWVRDSTARREIAQLQTDVSGLVIPDPSDTAPQMDGTAAAGSSADYSRADHVHPVDTSRQAALSQAQLDAVNSGITAAKVVSYDAIQVPTKTSELTNDSGFITQSAIPSVPTASTASPAMDGTASAGSSTSWSRGDHVHPTDTSRQAALNTAQMAAVNSGITADDLAVNDASVLCDVTPIVPTLSTGSHYQAWGGCWYYKIGHRVTVHIAVGGLTSGTDTTLWTMPAGYIPYSTIGNTGLGSSMSNYMRIKVMSSGAVHVSSSGANGLGVIEYDAFS